MPHRTLVRVLTSVLTTLLLTLGVLGAVALATSAPASADTQVIPIPTSSSGAGRIVTAPNGTIWFTEQDADKVGRIVGGQVSEITFPAQFPGTTKVMDLAVAPDSSVWVIYESGRRVRHMDANGATIADGEIGQYPYGEQVRVAPDGTAWITMSYDEQYVIRIVGTTIYDDPNAPACDDALGLASDGSMWCRTDSGLTHLNATASGGTTYPVNHFAAYPYSIAAGPTGSIWFGRYDSGSSFTSPSDGEVGYVDAASGKITAFSTGERTAPSDLVRGPDNAMWFTSSGADKGIGRVTASGSVSLTPIGNYAPQHLTFANDGTIWATDPTNNVLIHVSTSGLGAGGSTVGKIKAGKKPLSVRKGRVAVRIACPKSAGARCSGKAVLKTAQKKSRGLSKSAKYRIKAGKTRTVQIRLSTRGLAVLRQHRVTKVRVQLKVKGSSKPAVTKTIRVRRP